MDIEEFLKQVQPRAKRSKLEPFKAQIFELKAKGYANVQVCEWLATNGVKISQEGLRKFIERREQTKQLPISNPKDQQTGSKQEEAPPVVKTESDPESPVIGSHDPADLRKIFASNPDLAAYAKIAKGMKK